MEFVKDHMEKDEGESVSNISEPKNNVDHIPLEDDSDYEGDEFEDDRSERSTT